MVQKKMPVRKFATVQNFVKMKKQSYVSLKEGQKAKRIKFDFKDPVQKLSRRIKPNLLYAIINATQLLL